MILIVFKRFLKRISNTSILCILAIFLFTAQFNSLSGKQITSGYYNKRVILDGKLTEWNRIKGVNLNGKKTGSENRVILKSCWDDTMLYFSFRVRDKDLRAYQTMQDDPRLFLDDMVEMLLDTNNNKDSCWSSDDIVYHINLLGTKKDDRGTKDCKSDPLWDGNAIYSVNLQGTLNDTLDVDHGYYVEIGIPWSELGQNPRVGLQLGFNFANGDNDGLGRQLYDWSGAWPMRSPFAFGTLILKGVQKLKK